MNINRDKMDNIDMMRVLDTTMGQIACSALKMFKRKAAVTETRPRKILLVKYFGFGNIIMISPSFHALKQMFPDCEITFLTFKENKSLLECYKNVDKTIYIDRRSIFMLPFNVIKLVFKLRKENYDLLLDFEQFSRFSAIISFMSGAKRSIGFRITGNPRGALYDDEIECDDRTHAVSLFWKVINTLNGKNREMKLEKIAFGKEDEAHVDKLLGKTIRKKIVFHVGTGPNATERRWDMENFVELGRRLAKRDISIILTGSKNDEKENDLFRSQFEGDFIDLSNKLAIPQLAYLLSKADCFLSSDTGPAHLAASMNTPAVVLYGPSNPNIYGAWGENVKYIWNRIWCSPCMKNANSKAVVCINSTYKKCMKDITVDEVETAIMEKING